MLGHGSDHALAQLALLEDDQSRNAHHVVGAGGLGILVDIEFRHSELALVLGGDLFDDGFDHPARAAPCRPEVDEHRSVARDELVEVLVVGGDGVGRHSVCDRPGAAILLLLLWGREPRPALGHSWASSHRSASMAASQPVPAAVTA